MPAVSISAGNSKLGKIPNISLPPGITCPAWAACKRSGCYAMKAWRQYPNVRRACGDNMEAWLDDPMAYFAAVEDYLDAKRPKYFRWHAAGDIPSQDYFEAMKITAHGYPGTRFLCFTKRGYLDLGFVPDNLALVFSQWPGMPLQGPKTAPCAFLAEDPRTPAKAFKCPGSCAKCKRCWSLSSGQAVALPRH